MEVEVDLERDAFAVRFDAGRVNGEGIEKVIRVLGFRPRRASAEDLAAREPGVAQGEPPEPVAAVLARARDENRLVLIDFYADWCAPCEIVHTEVLPHPSVKQALARYIVLRIDADELLEVVEHFRVAAMPTLLALDPDGKELRRFEGLPEPEELAAQLGALRRLPPPEEGP